MASIPTPLTDLRKSTTVPFDRIYLDPNNPRIAPESAPGYDNPDKLFEAGLQGPLEDRVRGVYQGVESLEDSIVKQGWIPIDPIIVWEHPKKKGHFVVVEGNTRTVALRRLRGERLERERKILDRLKSAGNTPKHSLAEQDTLVQSLEAIVAATTNLDVFPFAADTPAELQQKLPKLLGVRHISHAQQWNPYATNLYILSLYERAFREKHGPDKKLELEAPLIKLVADMVSRPDTTTRKNLQSVAAFTDFKRRFSDKLPDGEQFYDQDHYFFEQILGSRFTQDQFDIPKDKLELGEEGAQALFSWAFSKPRNKAAGTDDDDNENVLYKAESIGLWSKIHSYDAKKGTFLSSQLDVNNPSKATPMRIVESQYLAHKTNRSAIDTLESLREALFALKADTLIAQRDHLQPLLEEILERATKYKNMMGAAGE